MTTKLEQFEENFADAKAKYLEIMKGENDAAILFKWIAENDINEWGVFHKSANGCDTLEGWVGMYHTLHHALYDDGDVTFVKTENQGPKIVFYSKHEQNFEEVFYYDLDNYLKKSFKIIGFLDTVQDVIAEYKKHEDERNALFEYLESYRKRK